MGSGTTLIEAKLLNRNAIGIDVNGEALNLSRENLKFDSQSNSKIFLKQGDARELSFIKSESLDLICTHPPYAHIIRYSEEIREDISLLSLERFVQAMTNVAKESLRVLKEGKVCTIMMGDIRRNGNVIPLGFQVMNSFLRVGFKTKEIIIKEQHNCGSNRYWVERPKNFLMLAHEYIFVFLK